MPISITPIRVSDFDFRKKKNVENLMAPLPIKKEFPLAPNVLN